jgi:hypothetical protein
MTQEEVDTVIHDALMDWEYAMHTHQLKFVKILCNLKDALEVEAIYHERVKQEYADYRAKVVATLTREADLAAGMSLLTSPERLRELVAMLEKP